MTSSAGPEQLKAFLASRGRPADVVGWTPLAGGRSAQTILADLRNTDGSTQRIVIHLQQAHGPLAERSDVGRQFELLGALTSSSVPAPKPLWWSDDRSFFGAPFLVNEFIAGDAPNPWRADGRAYLSRERGGSLAQNYLDTLADIHRVPLESLPASLPVPDSFAREELDRWSGVVARSEPFRDDPVLAYAESWLRNRLPVAERRGLVHGDYRFGNLVVRASRIVGVLDWELAEIGDPLFDLAAACAPPLRARNPEDDFMTVSELVDGYERATGAAVDRDALKFFTVLATYKIAALWVNASLAYERTRSIAALRAGFSVLEVRPMLAETLGLRVPTNRTATGQDSALQTLAGELQEVIGSELADPVAKEKVTHVVAVLNALGRRASATELAGRRRHVQTFLRRVQREMPGSLPDSGSPEVALAHVSRLVNGRQPNDPVTARVGDLLRPLVGEAALPEFAIWP
jgi:aminoglycoside phosphotransferase (APT) family kinase protein